MAWRRRWAIGLLGLTLSGCTAPGVVGTGSAHVVLPVLRRIQYVAADLRVLQVTVTSQASGQTYVRAFPAPSLTSAKPFQFVADNLPPGSYTATLQAYLDDAATLLVGSSTSAPFSVSAFTTTPVNLPNLVLAATPTGDWRMTVGVSLHGTFAVTDYAVELQTPGGVRVTVPAGSAQAGGTTFTWGNVAAYPSAVSTTSVTLTASNKKGQPVTKTQIATASITANATQSSTLQFAFP
ncbi:MAG TPA: hypothetical protein V6D05_04195 [Stenomitos sp.]